MIGVHKSTIARELSRNVTNRGRYAKEYHQQVVQHKTFKHQEPRAAGQ